MQTLCKQARQFGMLGLTPARKYAMATVGQVIDQLLPSGSRGTEGNIDDCPEWPPDLFAVVATLAERAGIYAEPPFTAGWDSNHFHFGAQYLATVKTAAAKWAKDAQPPAEVAELWARLVGSQDANLQEEGPKASGWKTTLMTLIAISDEAAGGIGFLPERGSDLYIPKLFLADHIEKLKYEMSNKESDEEPKLSMPYIPMSVCRLISPFDACVQPKTMTPGVGCNLRSLSHHLALLPSRGTVATSWYCAYSPENVQGKKDKPFNILLIPYPYSIKGNSFSCTEVDEATNTGFFCLEHSWIRGVTTDDLADFVCSLIEHAEKDVGCVHAVVLPEGALAAEQAAEISQKIASKRLELELFVSGTLSDSHATQCKNAAYTSRFHNGVRIKDWSQSKHHRWKLDGNQIRQYHLGHSLDPTKLWWEKIDISNRTCVFTVVRPGASLAVLVCEDLARFDPVMPVLNAVGPNLVIALLMDGPQLERRWPGRYATVLADDPGSSVLTLTSLGMIERSRRPGEGGPSQVALWKEPGGRAQELCLGAADHALVLALSVSTQEQFTLDGRTDGKEARQFSLSAVRGVRLPETPPWAGLD